MRAPAVLPAGLPRHAASAFLGASVALGLAGDLLLRATPWGLNVTTFCAALCATVFAFEFAFGHRAAATAPWLVLTLTFSVLFAVRASEVIQVLCLAACALCLGMASFAVPDRGARTATLTAFVVHLMVAAALSLGTLAILLARNVDYRLLVASRRARTVPAVGRGALIALPVAGAFAGLFAAADIFFRELLVGLFEFDSRAILSHVAVTALAGWLAGSYLFSVVSVRPPAVDGFEPPRQLRLGAVETAMLFGLVNLVFVAFVGVQFRYLFGGAARVEQSASLTYAEYARRGFFELVAVAGLVVVVLLVAHWLLHGASQARRIFVVLASALLVLVVIVLASAAERMRLYMDNYGLTELRLYTSLFMAWLLVLLVWLAATVLRDRRDRFTFGAALSGLAFVGLAAAMNADALIVRQNLSGDLQARPPDLDYLIDLGPDGIPALIDSIERVPGAEQCRVLLEVHDRYGESERGWRTWNYGRWNATRAARDATALVPGCQ